LASRKLHIRTGDNIEEGRERKPRRRRKRKRPLVRKMSITKS